MLNFVLGRACSGKSHYIINKAAEASLSKKVVIVIPEQFSFETERAILHTENFNNDNIKVLSFTKLYSEVSRIAGFGKLPVMSDGERILLTDMALRESAEQLRIFDRFVGFPDFSAKIADTINDFKLAAVSADQIMEAAEEIGGSCGAKLYDIAVVMSVYDALVSDKFIDPNDYLTRLYSILEDVDYFNGTEVFFDSFSGFTGQQFKVIDRILLQADNVTFSFCTENIDDTDLNVFYNINKTAQRLISMADAGRVNIGQTVRLDKNYYSSNILKDLEKSFVIQNSKSTEMDVNDDLRIVSCSDPREEAFAASAIIRHLVDSQNYRYKDFIIVARNADTYKNYIEVFCKKNGIQCFFDKKVNLTDTILYIYLESLLKIKASFSTENILTWLKCGFNSYKAEDIYALEDYIYVWNISGKDWANEWIMSPSGFDNGEISNEDKVLLADLNRIRADIYKRLSAFCSSFKGTASMRSEAIYNFLVSENADKHLSVICERFEDDGDKFSASVLRQSWDRIMQILDSVAKLYKNDIKTEEYIKAITISCKAVAVSNIPQMLDEVTFGSADRIRPSKPKIAIILGANQGVFPNHSLKTGLLATADKRKLEEYGISLNDDEIKSAVEENYLVYSMVCCPIDKTFILYSKKSVSGEQLEPSAFLIKTVDNFEGVKVTDYDALSESAFMPATPKTAAYLMSDLYGEKFETVKASLKDQPDVGHILESFEKDSFNDSFIVSKENADKLFNDSIYISASKFDDFHSCRLMYFLKFGLKTGKIRQADLNAMQRGTITHYVLETLINTYHKKLGELTENEISGEVDRLIDEYVDSVIGADILLTPRFKFLLSKIAQSVKGVVLHIAEEFSQSDFEPIYCELEISEKGDVPELRIPIDKGEMVLTGKIDRVDLFKNTVRIVDYKTGSKSFELSDTLFGLNMQMLIYLYALVKNGDSLSHDLRAGGILYMPAKNDSKTKKLTMNGLILEDEEVIRAMDKENKGKFIPAYKTGNKAFVDEELFSLIFANIENLIKSMGNTIRQGDFIPAPVDAIGSDACKYCDYESVCRRKTSKHLKVAKQSNEEIREKLKGGDTSGV